MSNKINLDGLVFGGTRAQKEVTIAEIAKAALAAFPIAYCIDPSGSMDPDFKEITMDPFPPADYSMPIVAGGGTSLDAAVELHRHIAKPSGAGGLLIVFTDGE